jgi:hypothetical protein
VVPADQCWANQPAAGTKLTPATVSRFAIRVTPLSSHGQPRTLTALAITSPAVDSATIACTVIIIFAQRASGMVSVGENAIPLVMLRFR